MAKNIVKEIIIILLLTLAIILILGVLLYEYVPSNKIVPETVSYVTPENVRQELENINQEVEEEVVMTYQVDATDLKNYQKVKDYVPGKKNPFSESATPQDTNTGNTTGGTSTNGQTTNTNSGTTTNGNTNTNPQDQNTGYFQNKGTK